MSEALFPYYERELLFFRQLAQEFAKQYPAPAGRLMLQENTAVDPHVERLIEAFALISGRIHRKLDDEFPELTEALFSVLYPHYLAPVPSMAVVQFEVNAAQAPLPEGFLIERHSKLQSNPVGPTQLRCQFRTGYPVKLWPVAVTGARLQPPPFPQGFRPPPGAAAALRLQLECQADMTFAQLALDRLRFYLSGDNQLAANLYELLFNDVLQVVLRPGDRDAGPAPIVLSPEACLRQVGFEADEGLLPYPNNSFLGYRLLTEFFAFREKFLFVDVGGLERACRAKFQRKLEIVLFLRRTLPSLEQGIDGQTFRLGCTPVVNLFEHVAQGMHLTQAQYEYRVVPEPAHPLGYEVYSVDEVTHTDPTTSTTKQFQPFYSFRHGAGRDERQAFWYAARRPSVGAEGDRGTDVYLTLTDLAFDPHLPAEAVLVPRVTCTNRDLPGQLQRAGEDLHLELLKMAPLNRVRCLRTPTLPLRPPLRRGHYWRLVSHLNLNHLSLTDAAEGRAALQELLRLYDFSDPEAGQQLAAVTRNVIDGLLAVEGRRVVGRTGSPVSSGFARGVEVTLTFDEQKYVGVGAFLFASVLERFLGLYVSLNSFSQLVARTKQGEGYLKKWPPRAGEVRLL